MVDWLIYFGAILLLIYFAVWLSAPQKWAFSLLLLIYAIAMVFIADGVRADYGSSNVVYGFLYVSTTIAACFFILIPLIYGIFRLYLFPFVRDSTERARLCDNAYWLFAGILVPFLFLDARLFTRCPGGVLMAALLATGFLAIALFLLLRSRTSPRSIWLYLPGYALGTPVMLVVSLYYGAKVLPAAIATAQGAPFCVESGWGNQVNSLFDMTPLTLISHEHSEYHANLVVETTERTKIYNWSWKTLSFSPVKPDMYYLGTCAKQ